MTSIPTYEDNKEDNVQLIQTIETPQVLHDAEPLQEIENNEAKNIYDLCPPSIKREIMTRLTKKKILLYDPDMLSSEALQVVIRVKEAYDRKKQRSCNDLKNKRLAKQTTSGQPVEEADGGEGCAEASEEAEEKYDSPKVLQPAKILDLSGAEGCGKQVRKLREPRKNVAKKEVPPPIEPQTPRASPPQNLQPVKVGLFKSEICDTIPRVSTKLFM